MALKGKTEGSGPFGWGFWPWFACRRYRFFSDFVDGYLDQGVLSNLLRRLDLRPEPADLAVALFTVAFSVECDETTQDFLVGQIGRPAVGFGDRFVQIVVQGAKNRYECLLVDRSVTIVQRFTDPLLGQNVVDIR